MKKLLLILLLLPVQTYVQAQQATIKLADGTFINNAPTGRDWTGYEVKGISLKEASDTLIIDDSEQDKITYYGNWRISDTLAIGAKEGRCYCSWSQSPNDSIVVKFTNATRFEWIGETMAHQGIADIYFDGVYQVTVDTYNAVNKRFTMNWYINNLDTSRAYTFKLVAKGEKNACGTGTFVANQYFRIIKLKAGQLPEPIPIEPISPDTIPPSVIVIDTIRIIDLNYSIIRDGRYKVFLDGVQEDQTHNEYEKAIQHGLKIKALNRTKNVVVQSPNRKITLK